MLKVVGGDIAWSSDLSGGGSGSSAWATTSDDLALYPADPTDIVLIGAAATTTTSNILEVNGNSLLRGSLTAYGAATAPTFTATSSSATSTFPRLNITGSLGLGSDYVTDFTGSGLTITSGALTLDTSGTWSGTLGGYTASQLLAGAFSTTSADAWSDTRNFFASSSADYWQSQRNFFATTSADYWETQQTARTADDLTNNSIEDLQDVAAMTENYGDLFAWNGSAWSDFATSSLGIALSDTTGTLAVSKGGTGATTFNYGLVLSPGGTAALTNIATSSLGLLTTHVAEGSNLYYTDGRVQTYLDGVSKGFFFSTTSADAWKDQRNFFSTTSATYFLAQNQGGAFSTTSATYFVQASTTIPKTYTANTWTGTNTFSALTLGAFNGPLHANAGVLSATTSIGVLYGGTGLASAPTYGQILVGNSSGGYTLMATSSLGITGGSSLFTDGGATTYLTAADNLGLGTSTANAKLTVYGDALLEGASRYLNFGTTTGSNGYGFRDNAGTLEFKNSGGSWQGVTTATTGPSFSVNKGGTDQTAIAGAATALTWSTELFDTNNNFDLSTERFTPTVPGKYLISGTLFTTNAAASDGYCNAFIYKNGSSVARTQSVTNANTNATCQVTMAVDMNGSTDYVELYVATNGTTISGNATFTYFTGALIAPVNATAGGWQIDGTQSFLADSTDKVGIGTSTAWAKLAVQSTAGIPQFVIGSSTTQFIVDRNGNVGIGTTSPYVKLAVSGGNAVLNNAFIGDIGISSSYAGFSHFATATSGSYALLQENIGNTFLNAASGRSIYFRINNADKMILDSSGNIGIGTTSPWAKLSINSTTGIPQFVIGSSTTQFIVDQSGNVGVGTTTPNAKLQILKDGTYNDASTAALRLSNATTPLKQLFMGYDNSVDAAFIQSTHDGTTVKPLLLNAAGGNVFIGGTTGPVSGTEMLGVYGPVGWKTTASTASYVWTNSGTGGAPTATLFSFFNSSGGTPIGAISYNGTNVAYNTSSDHRIKESIATSTLGLDAVMQLPIYEFSFKNDPTHATTTGFIAQELFKVFPWAVTTNGDDGTTPLGASSTPWAVDYGRITPLIVKAVQDIANIAGTFKANLIAWLADARKGIENLFAKNLYAVNGTFESVATKQLCAIKSDGSQVCLTGDQLGALLSQTAGAATVVSVPPSASNISEPEPPISVSSTSTPEVASSPPEAPALEPEVEEPLTEVASADATPNAANDNDATPADQPGITEPANDHPSAPAATDNVPPPTAEAI